MIAVVGLLGIVAGVVGGAWLALTALSHRPGRPLPDLGRPVMMLMWGSAVSMLALVAGLVADDFSIRYVANHSARSTPLVFKVASAWGALEGSIVLWGLVLAVAVGWSWRSRRTTADRLDVLALGVMGVVAVFFFGLMATVANPFEVCTAPAAIGCADSSWWPFVAGEAPAEGRGPNPLLQNHILMAIHPPMLYLGYVGLTAPFAYAIAALLLGTPGVEWVNRTRRLTLLAWSFLTIGILLGAWWSYEVLGWGGYWGWDPVENASLLPWITATAFLHSSAVQVRRGALQAWNFVLVIASFALTILGTFLTRSGVITSVHSFTESAISPLLLGFFVVVVVVGLGLFALRAHLVAVPGSVDRAVSREGGLLVNNVLLSAWALTVLIGTIYPILVEAFATRTVGVGRGFFDATTLPLAFALLLVMGFAEVAPWKQASWTAIRTRVAGPAQAALGVGAGAVLLGVRSRGALVAIVLAVFVATPPLKELARQGKARVERGATWGSALVGIVGRDRGYWGGMLAHLGIAVIVIGIAGSGGLATTDREITLPRNQPVAVAGYTLTYENGFTTTEPQRTVTGARIELRRDGDLVSVLEPTINDYRVQAVPTPAVDTSVVRDVYVSLRSISGDRAIVDMYVFPLQWMVWVGGFVVAAGGFWSLSGKARVRETAHA